MHPAGYSSLPFKPDQGNGNMMARLLLLFFLFVYFAPVQAARSCVVLQYHHVSNDTPAITSVTPEQFNEHLDYLKTNNFKVMPLREVVAALQNNTELPEKCVSLTVDDAYASVYQNAWPRLKALNWPMTVFVNSDGVDRGIASYMTWQQMREMSQHGVAFENHGHTHAHLIRRQPGETTAAWRDRISNDIQTAQQRITREIGTAPRLFAHPFGEYNPQTLQLIKAIGLTGFGQQSGPLWPGADFGALPRFPMNTCYAAMPGFRTKVKSLALPVVAASGHPDHQVIWTDRLRPAIGPALAGCRFRCIAALPHECALCRHAGFQDQGQLTTPCGCSGRTRRPARTIGAMAS